MPIPNIVMAIFVFYFTFRPPPQKENLIFLFRQFIANYTHYYVLIIQYSINVENDD